MSEVFHRIYTHVPDGSGARFEKCERDASEVLPKEALSELDDLLRKLTPGDDRAFAMRRFAGDRESFACVVVAQRGFVDVDKRDGLRAHARVVRLDETWFDPRPLIQAALNDHDRIELPALTASSFGSVPNQLLEDVLIASVAKLGKREAVAVSTDANLERIAFAWAAMPSGLQRESAWAFNAGDGAPVDVIWASDGTDPAALAGPKTTACIKSYVQLLAAGYDLARSDAIRDVAELQRVVENARKQAKGEMTNSRRRKPEPDVDPADADGIADLNRQYSAIQTSLRNYVDQRIDALESRMQTGGATQPAALPILPLAILTLGALLLGAGLMWAYQKWWPREDAPAAVSATTEPTETRAEPATTPEVKPGPAAAFISQAEKDGKWAEGLATFAEKHPAALAKMVDRVANSQDTTDAIRKQLTALGTRLGGTGKAVGPEDRAALRPILFEYVAKQEGNDLTIDGKLTDLDAQLLQRAKTSWGWKSPVADVNSRELHSEAILRWIEANRT